MNLMTNATHPLQISFSDTWETVMLHNQKKHQRNRKRLLTRLGTTSVEFAIVAPVFVFVIAVCGEFARLSMMRNLAQNAAYEAARYVMAEGAKVSDGIARALVGFDGETFPTMRDGQFLTRDSRMKERKHYGLRGARRGVQFSKR